MKIDFSNSYHNFASGFVPWIDFIYLLRLMDILAILFCTIPDIDMVNLDRLFLQGWVKWYSERHCICPRQK